MCKLLGLETWNQFDTGIRGIRGVRGIVSGLGWSMACNYRERRDIPEVITVSRRHDERTYPQAI